MQCVRDQDRLVVYVGHAAGKQWWRNFIGGRSVTVRVGGSTYLGHGRVVGSEDPDRALAEQVYHRRYPKVDIAGPDPMVLIDLASAMPDGRRP